MVSVKLDRKIPLILRFYLPHPTVIPAEAGIQGTSQHGFESKISRECHVPQRIIAAR